jgi:hypothetical protein
MLAFGAGDSGSNPLGARSSSSLVARDGISLSADRIDLSGIPSR